MSVDFRGLRPTSNDPLLALFVELQKSVLKGIRDQQFELLDSDNEDIFSDGQDMDTAIKYHSELSSTHKFTFIKDYYPPFEPDGDHVKMWVRGNNTGNTSQDYSGFGRFTTIHGDPTLVDGTIDLGIRDGGAVKSIARRMNRPTSDYENAEWLQVADDDGLQLAGQTIGFSIFTRIRLFSLDIQEGIRPTIFEKIDDSTPNNAIMMMVSSLGRIMFVVKRGGSVVVAKQTPTSAVTTNVVYDIFVTYAVSGDVPHIYINGVDQTLTDTGDPLEWHDTLTNHDFFLFRRGLGTDGGFVYGDFYDLKYYREKVVTAQQVTNHWTNKWSISDIAFGEVMITNYWATKWTGGAPPGGPSFTALSFSPLSFTV